MPLVSKFSLVYPNFSWFIIRWCRYFPNQMLPSMFLQQKNSNTFLKHILQYFAQRAEGWRIDVLKVKDHQNCGRVLTMQCTTCTMYARILKSYPVCDKTRLCTTPDVNGFPALLSIIKTVYNHENYPLCVNLALPMGGSIDSPVPKSLAKAELIPSCVHWKAVLLGQIWENHPTPDINTDSAVWM